VAVEESEHGRFSVELAVAAGEGVVGDDAAPELAHEGRPHEARGVIGREAEDDVSDDVRRQLRRLERLRHGARRRWVGGEEAKGLELWMGPRD
jgi:hypothetical protein